MDLILLDILTFGLDLPLAVIVTLATNVSELHFAIISDKLERIPSFMLAATWTVGFDSSVTLAVHMDLLLIRPTNELFLSFVAPIYKLLALFTLVDIGHMLRPVGG